MKTGFVCAAIFLGLFAANRAGAHDVTFDERVAAQKAIEGVYWNHRIWPTQNPSMKPLLSDVMSDDVIRSKVENYLKMSNALDTWWRQPITGQQLQMELDRITRDTRDGAVLQELYRALGNDAALIAETLVRQTLAERLIRSRYSADARFHGDVKARVEAALAACSSIDCMKSMGGEYRETTWRRGVGPTERAADGRRRVLLLPSDDWKDHLSRLATQMRGTADSLPTGKLSGLEETADAFAVTTVLAQREGEVTTASVRWPKRSFEAWWASEQGAVGSTIRQPAESFALPTFSLTTCPDDTWTPTGFLVPGPEELHTAVWTGTEMIVWGGSNPSDTNTGARYNPSTDSWMPTSTGAFVPDARIRHTAVWTGTEMIVWGGSNPSYLNTGGRYDPSTNTWKATSTGSNVPDSRDGHTAVWTGSEMIVWGGNNPAYLNTGGRYNPSTDSWTATSTGGAVPAGRYAHTAVWTGTEMIVWGGSNPAYLNTGGRYDPATDNWTVTSTGTSLPTARDLHSAVWTGTQMIVWGGTNGTFLNTGGSYDPSTDSWTATSTGPGTPAARGTHTAVWTGSEMIVWGGTNPGYLNTGGRYKPSTDSWSAISAAAGVPVARTRHTAVWTGAEMIVWGGSNPGYLNTGARYDPTTDSWTATLINTVPTPRYYHTAVWTGSEMIVWGGISDVGYANTGGRYNPSLDLWTATAMNGAPDARYWHSAIWTGKDLIVWGGYAYNSDSNTGGRFSPSTNSWTATSTAAGVPSARESHTAIWTGTEMIVWGGSSNNSPFNTGGRYNPSTDSWTATSTGAGVPSARSFHTSVWTHKEMIVWGGDDGTQHQLDSGSRYNPSTDSWTTTSTGANVPSGRSSHTAVWTGTEMIVWGGYDAGQFLNTGARYTPSTDSWTAVATGTNAPTPRALHTAVWTGNEMIVWGGTNAVNASGPLSTGGRYSPSNDTWTVTSTGTNLPAARSEHTAVWTGMEMIIWGGSGPYFQNTGGRYCVCPLGSCGSGGLRGPSPPYVHPVYWQLKPLGPPRMSVSQSPT